MLEGVWLLLDVVQCLFDNDGCSFITHLWRVILTVLSLSLSLSLSTLSSWWPLFVGKFVEQ